MVINRLLIGPTPSQNLIGAFIHRSAPLPVAGPTTYHGHRPPHGVHFPWVPKAMAPPLWGPRHGCNHRLWLTYLVVVDRMALRPTAPATHTTKDRNDSPRSDGLFFPHRLLSSADPARQRIILRSTVASRVCAMLCSSTVSPIHAFHGMSYVCGPLHPPSYRKALVGGPTVSPVQRDVGAVTVTALPRDPRTQSVIRTSAQAGYPTRRVGYRSLTGPGGHNR